MTDSSKAKSLGGVAFVCRSLLVLTNIYTLVNNQMIRRNTLPAAEVLNKTMSSKLITKLRWCINHNKYYNIYQNPHIMSTKSEYMKSLWCFVYKKPWKFNKIGHLHMAFSIQSLTSIITSNISQQN